MNETNESLHVVTEKNVPGCFTAFLLHNDIIEIKWDTDLKEVDKKHLVQIKEVIKEFGKGNKMRMYFSTNDFMNITSAARKYAASEEGQEFTLANAVLIDHLGKRLLFNFFLSVNQPSTPTKGFTTREKAIAWLQNLS